MPIGSATIDRAHRPRSIEHVDGTASPVVRRPELVEPPLDTAPISGLRYGEAGRGEHRPLPANNPLSLRTTHGSSLEPNAFASRFLTRDGLYERGHEAKFKSWALKQVDQNPHIGKVYRAVIDRLKQDDRPETVAALFEHAQRAARDSLKNDPELPQDRLLVDRLVMLSALVGLAAHALQSNKGEVTCLFPRYIPDGRAGEAGFDKSWHLIDHAMFTFVVLFDRTYGSGALADDFARAVAEADAHDAARWVSAAYDRFRGACGGMVPGTLPGPIGEETVYFAPPSFSSNEEREAYELAVRIGDAHEYREELGDPSLIGANRSWSDPLAEIEATFDAYSSLRDAGSFRDLTANRIGAFLGVTAFRDPSRTREIPFDDGAYAAGQTYAAGRSVPAREYLGLELYCLARLRDPNGNAEEMLARAIEEAGALGPEAATKRLIAELSDLIDERIGDDRDLLARYYATYSVRYLQFGWRLPIDGEERRWQPHVDFARTSSRGTLMFHFLRRVAATANAFDPPLSVVVPEASALEARGSGRDVEVRPRAPSPE